MERRIFSENATLFDFFEALVALEPLVSLMSRFGACSARIRGDRQTIYGQTHIYSIRTEPL